MRVQASDGAGLQVTVIGHGPPVLWLSGGPGLNNYLRPVAAALPGFRHIVPDARGTGASEGGAHDIVAALQDLETIRRQIDVDTWAVVGHSWGADLGLAYAMSAPARIASLISFAGTGIQNDRGWHAAYQARLDTEPHGSYEYSEAVHRSLIDDWRRFLQTPDLLRQLAVLSVPVTFLQASEDIRPNWPARQVAGLVPGSHYLELAGAPHEAWLTHGGLLNTVLSQLLTETREQ